MNNYFFFLAAGFLAAGFLAAFFLVAIVFYFGCLTYLRNLSFSEGAGILLSGAPIVNGVNKNVFQRRHRQILVRWPARRVIRSQVLKIIRLTTRGGRRKPISAANG